MRSKRSSDMAQFEALVLRCGVWPAAILGAVAVTIRCLIPLHGMYQSHGTAIEPIIVKI